MMFFVFKLLKQLIPVIFYATSSLGLADVQVSCFYQPRQVLLVFFCLKCLLDFILQQDFVENNLQKYICCPEPTTVIIMCYWHRYCLKIKAYAR